MMGLKLKSGDLIWEFCYNRFHFCVEDISRVFHS